MAINNIYEIYQTYDQRLSSTATATVMQYMTILLLRHDRELYYLDWSEIASDPKWKHLIADCVVASDHYELSDEEAVWFKLNDIMYELGGKTLIQCSEVRLPVSYFTK